MSDYVKPSAIPWADRVCEEFERHTGQKLAFDPPRQSFPLDGTEIRFYIWESGSEAIMCFSDGFINSDNLKLAVEIVHKQIQRNE